MKSQKAAKTKPISCLVPDGSILRGNDSFRPLLPHSETTNGWFFLGDQTSKQPHVDVDVFKILQADDPPAYLIKVQVRAASPLRERSGNAQRQHNNCYGNSASPSFNVGTKILGHRHYCVFSLFCYQRRESMRYTTVEAPSASVKSVRVPYPRPVLRIVHRAIVHIGRRRNCLFVVL